MAKRKPTITAGTLADLTPDSHNVNQGSQRGGEMLRRSLQEYGAARSIVVDANMKVIAGNQTVEACGAVGLDDVLIVPSDGTRLVVVQRTDVDITTATGRELAIADNRTNQVGYMPDPLMLAEHAADGVDLGKFWFDSEIDELGLPNLEPLDLDDGAPAEAEAGVSCGPAVTVPGDLWVMGDHRLLCGDSCDPDVLLRVMGDDRAACVFTDPPYNLAEHNQIAARSVRKAYGNLKGAEWDQGFDVVRFLAALPPALAPDCTLFVCTSHHLAGDVWRWMADNCDHHNLCVWSKPNPMPSLAKRHWTWATELICYGTRGRHTFNFPAQGHALNVWTINSPAHTTEHPTEKPVGVVLHALRHSSNSGDVVLDAFGGSGTTLIACQQLARSARLVELDPTWCDVIVNRWQQMTGQQATHEAGHTFGAGQMDPGLK